MTWLFSVIVLFLVAIILTNEFYQQKMHVPPMPTMPAVRCAMVKHATPDIDGDIYELGAGWGGIALNMARRHPDRKVIGIEGSPFPFLFANLRLLLNPSVKNLTFKRQNFFDVPLEDAAVILCYLTNPLMAKLKPKFESDLRSGAKVISSTFFIPDWIPITEEKLEGLWKTTIYIYKKGPAA